MSIINETNSTIFSQENILISQERRTTALIFGIFSSIGILLNLLPLILTYTSNLRKNFVHTFITNLCAADLMLSACFLFGNTFYILYREQVSDLACRWLGFFIFTAAYQEFVFPPLLSINRYVALYHKPIYDKIYTKWSMVIIVIGSWIVCALMPLVFYFFYRTGYDTDNEHCCVTVVGDKTWTIIYWVVVVAPLVIFCDGTMLYCNIKMYKKLHNHGGNGGTDNNKNEKSKSSNRNIVRQNRELLWFLWADMSLPICLHTVYHVMKFVITDRRSVNVRRFFAMLYLVNTCLRAILTLGLLRPYRVALKNTICFWNKSYNVVDIAVMTTTKNAKSQI